MELSVSDLADNDGGLIFNSATIERKEMLILRALKWRMRSDNPFSFLIYLVSLFVSGDDKRLIQALKNRGAHIIFKSQHDSRGGWEIVQSHAANPRNHRRRSRRSSRLVNREAVEGNSPSPA